MWCRALGSRSLGMTRGVDGPLKHDLPHVLPRRISRSIRQWVWT